MPRSTDSLSTDQIDAVIHDAKAKAYKRFKVKGDPPLPRREWLEAVAKMCYCEGYKWGVRDNLKPDVRLSKVADK